MDIHTGPETPPRIESEQPVGAVFSEIISSVKSGVLITIPQWGDVPKTFLIGSQRITEHKIQCFIDTEKLDMNSEDLMRNIFLEGDTQHLGVKLARFLDGSKISCDDLIS